MHDVVIRGGTVVDGTGAPPKTADVAVDDGVITGVGRVDEAGRPEPDALEATPRAIDVAAQVPHAALRAFVMGERAHDEAAEGDELTEMARIAEEALDAGAVGVTTSRTFLHSSRHGLVPGTNAPPDELLALADAVARAGHGVFEFV